MWRFHVSAKVVEHVTTNRKQAVVNDIPDLLSI